jgi:hypothetical protein
MTSSKFENVMCTNVRNYDVWILSAKILISERLHKEKKEKQPVVTSKHLMKMN